MSDIIVLTEAKMKELGISAFIRIKDLSGFFDNEMRRLGQMCSVVGNCEVSVYWIGTEPDVLLPLADPRSKWSSEKENVRSFQKEVERIGSLLKRLASLIDPQSRIEIDYPEKEEIQGRVVVRAYDLLSAFREKGKDDGLSTFLSPSLEKSIDSIMDLVFMPENWMMGICHSIWHLKKEILRDAFHIDWKTPAERHPHIIYD